MKKRGRVLKRAGKKDLLPSEEKRENLKRKQEELDTAKKSGSGGGLLPGSF